VRTEKRLARRTSQRAPSSYTTIVNVANPLTIDSASSVTIQNGSTLDVAGKIDNYGTMTLINGIVDTNGYDLVVKPTTGVLNLSGASMVELGVSAPGTLDVQGTLNQDWLSGGGATTIHGTVQNGSGYVFNSSSSGFMTTTVQGSYTQTSGGSLSLKINGATSGTGDRLTATGTATLGGTLTVSNVGTLNNGTWVLVSGATLTGSFTSVNLPTPPTGKYWQYSASATQFTITLLNQPSITINDVSMMEGQFGITVFTFTVWLSSASTQTISMDFATADGTATVVGNDYYANSGTLTFTPGQTTKTITVQVRGDATSESTENFFVNLSNAVNAWLLDSQGVGTIYNDDM